MLRHDERDVMRGELSDHGGKMRETAPQPVEFVANNDINLATPHSGHEPVETFARRFHTRNSVGDLLDIGPVAPGAIFAKLSKLRIVRLLAVDHPCLNINGLSHT